MNWTATGAIALGLGVTLGAFGAHELRGRLDAYSIDVFERAVFYHFLHALGILIIPALERMGLVDAKAAGRACWLLLTGIVLFAGSLYLLAVTGHRMLGAVTPLGGVSFIAAWVVLALGARKS